jgi:hypothetical protein
MSLWEMADKVGVAKGRIQLIRSQTYIIER